jgi:threonylcarbamoyladenosine tRNA methylthiotransferase MtaB
MTLDFQVHTFGCKVNSYDSGLIEKRMLALAGDFVLSESPRIHILNTCAVTKEATLEAGRLARKLKVRDPFCLVVATGCAAQVDTEELSNQKAIDLIVANSHKTDLQNILRRYYAGEKDQRVFKSNIFKKEDLEAGGGTDSLHTRSFLKIQDGCDSFCTYCVIPFARGKSRSIPVRDLVRRVNELQAQGSQEVVLTGVHIGDYRDEGKNLATLLKTLLAETNIQRFRLSSMEPPELTDEILTLYQDPRLCPHFHMSIQSAQSDVLKMMKRQYRVEDVQSALSKIAKNIPNAFVGMDVIVGFPTETEGQFSETVSNLEALPWNKIHVFPYSSRPGTFAARLMPLSPQVLKARAARLRALSDLRLQETAKRQVGLIKRILPLMSAGGRIKMRSRNGTSIGLSRDFWTVELPQEMLFASEIDVRILSVVASASNLAPTLLAQPL